MQTAVAIMSLVAGLIVSGCATSAEHLGRVYVAPPLDAIDQDRLAQLEQEHRWQRVETLEEHAQRPLDYVVLPDLGEEPPPLPRGTVPPRDVRQRVEWHQAREKQQELLHWAKQNNVRVISLEDLIGK